MDELGQGAQEAGGSRLPRRLGEEGAQGENDEGSETDAGDAAPTATERAPQQLSPAPQSVKGKGKGKAKRSDGAWESILEILEAETDEQLRCTCCCVYVQCVQ